MSEQTGKMIYRALAGQKRAVKSCELLLSAMRHFKEKDLIAAIRREERRHFYLLEGIYEEITGEACILPPASIALPRQLDEMLRSALCDKILAIEHYEELQKELSCSRDRDLLEMILCDQKEHARILAAIYQRL